jgi:predicted 2-oxoglutarate/Fe(II)-dependent dioxygenase YbiX
VNDLFVVKYKHDEQKYLEIHTDVSMFSFNILLSDQKDFEGGGTYFEDGITTFLEQGDMLIHSGRTKHSGKSITKGVRYVLVGFLDIKMKE